MEAEKVSRMKPEELQKFKQDLKDKKIFTSAHIPPGQETDLMGLIFIPIGLGSLKNWEDDDLKKIGLVFEYLDKASPRLMNGWPIFMTAHLLHKDDWKQVIEELKAEQVDKLEGEVVQ